MSVQSAGSYRGLSYYGNRSTKEVHKIAAKTANCQLDEIKDGVRFVPDSLSEAHKNGYDNCHYCLGGSTH